MKNQRELFSIDPKVIYLNGAYMSPILKSVEEAGINNVQLKRTPSLISSTDFFTNRTRVRKLYAQLIDTEQWENIAIIPSTSYGIATVAKNIKISAGQKIVMLHEQFPSNVYSWIRLAEENNAELCYIKAPDSHSERAKKWNESIIEAIDEQTAIVAMPHVHWADGTTYDLVNIRNRCDKVGAKLIIDGTQSVGALPFSVRNIKPDALVCGAYKWLMGPYSLGLAYYSDEICQGVPLEESWMNRLGAEDFSGLVNYQAQYPPGANRHMVGQSSNFVGLSMMIAALRQILEWTPAGIQSYCQEISTDTYNELISRGHHIDNSTDTAKHLTGVYFKEGTNTELLLQKLKAKNISVSFRGNAMRVSPHLYNTEEDFAQLLSCFED